jgi:hypothetical protein
MSKRKFEDADAADATAATAATAAIAAIAANVVPAGLQSAHRKIAKLDQLYRDVVLKIKNYPVNDDTPIGQREIIEEEISDIKYELIHILDVLDNYVVTKFDADVSDDDDDPSTLNDAAPSAPNATAAANVGLSNRSKRLKTAIITPHLLADLESAYPEIAKLGELFDRLAAADDNSEEEVETLENEIIEILDSLGDYVAKIEA